MDDNIFAIDILLGRLNTAGVLLVRDPLAVAAPPPKARRNSYVCEETSEL